MRLSRKEQTIRVQKRTSVLDKRTKRSNGTSHNKIKNMMVLKNELLSSRVHTKKTLLETQLIDELINRIDLFTNRVQKIAIGTSCNGKRDAWHTGASSNINELVLIGNSGSKQ